MLTTSFDLNCVLFMSFCRSQAFKDGTTQRMVVEMLQATAEQFQQKETNFETTHAYEKTKEIGYSALLNAGNTILSRISRTDPSAVAEPKKPNAWLTLGAAVASSFFTAAADRGMVLMQHFMGYLIEG